MCCTRTEGGWKKIFRIKLKLREVRAVYIKDPPKTVQVKKYKICLLKFLSFLLNFSLRVAAGV